MERLVNGQRYCPTEITSLTDVSSGTGIAFDVRVRIDQGHRHYMSDRYKEWTFLDVRSDKIDLNQSEVFVLQWHLKDLPQRVVRERCAAVLAGNVSDLSDEAWTAFHLVVWMLVSTGQFRHW